MTWWPENGKQHLRRAVIKPQVAEKAAGRGIRPRSFGMFCGSSARSQLGLRSLLKDVEGKHDGIHYAQDRAQDLSVGALFKDFSFPVPDFHG
jgi:hypothetical protein